MALSLLRVFFKLIILEITLLTNGVLNMLYKKNDLGRKYTRLITSSPIPFVSFVLFGVILFLFLTITTKIHVVKSDSPEELHLQRDVEHKSETLLYRIFVKGGKGHDR